MVKNNVCKIHVYLYMCSFINITKFDTKEYKDFVDNMKKFYEQEKEAK